MKKLILPLLLLVAIGMLAAVESDPSAVVGYFKKTIGDGVYQAIALPFDYPDLSVGAVLGDQFAEGDEATDINSGFGTTYYSGFGWDGDLTTLAYGAGYYIHRATGNGVANYYLLGTVDPNAFTVTIYGNGAYTAFGLDEAAPVALTDALFGTNETEGDGITEIDTGLGATYYAGYGWDGDLVATGIAPTFAYYYNCVGASNFVWTYTPTRGAVTQTLMSTGNSK
jgi:hypothetical protein